MLKLFFKRNHSIKWSNNCALKCVYRFINCMRVMSEIQKYKSTNLLMGFGNNMNYFMGRDQSFTSLKEELHQKETMFLQFSRRENIFLLLFSLLILNVEIPSKKCSIEYWLTRNSVKFHNDCTIYNAEWNINFVQEKSSSFKISS